MMPVEVGLDWHLRWGHDYFSAFLNSRAALDGRHNWVHVRFGDGDSRDDLAVYRLGDGSLSVEDWYGPVVRTFANRRPVTQIACHTDLALANGRASAAIRFTPDRPMEAMLLAHRGEGAFQPLGRTAVAREIMANAVPGIAVAGETMRQFLPITITV